MFNTKINSCVNKYRILIIVYSVIHLCFTSYIALSISPMTKQEFFIAEDHPRRIVFLTVEKTFPIKPDDKPEVTFSWGTSKLDQSKTNFWDR